MFKVMYANDTARVKHVGPVMIPPGESREVDERHLPGYRAKKSAPAPEVRAIDLDEVLSRPVKDVLAAVEGVSDDELRTLRDAEMGGKQRAGVLSGIEALLLQRAAQREGAGEDADETQGPHA